MKECVAEQIICNSADLADAINSLRFFWNIQRIKGRPLLIEFWAEAEKGREVIPNLVVPEGAD